MFKLVMYLIVGAFCFNVVHAVYALIADRREARREKAKADWDKAQKEADLGVRLIQAQTARETKGLPAIGLDSALAAVSKALPAQPMVRSIVSVPPSPALAVPAAAPVAAIVPSPQPIPLPTAESLEIRPEDVAVVFLKGARLVIGKYPELDLKVASLHTAGGTIELEIDAHLPDEEFYRLAEEAAVQQLSELRRQKQHDTVHASRKGRKGMRRAA